MVKDRPSGPKNKYAKSLKFNLSSFNEKPIVKNGYIVALFVFIGLVVAFNLADSYSKGAGNQVTGMSINMVNSLNNAFEPIFGPAGIVASVVYQFTGNNQIFVIKTMLAVVLYLILISALSGFKFFAHEKYKKVIVGLISMIGVIYLPPTLVIRIFGEGGAVNGIITLALVGIFTILPLWLLFRWGAREGTGRFEYFLIATLFFIMFSAMEYFSNELFQFTSTTGLIPTQTIREYVFLFGIITSIVGVGWALIKAFSGIGPTVEEAARETGRAIGAGAGAAREAARNAAERAKEKRKKERETLAKFDRTAVKFANAIKTIDLNTKVGITGKLDRKRAALSNYLNIARKSGINSRDAKRLLNSKGIRI